MTHATPRMISQRGLVCLPAAGNAGVGRRMASTNAHTSATRAASQSASKNQASGVITPAENTPLGYLVLAPDGQRVNDRPCPAFQRRCEGCGLRLRGAGVRGYEGMARSRRDPAGGIPPGWPEGQDLLD